MKKCKILSIIILLIIVLIGGFFIKKHFDDNKALENQMDELDTPSGTKIDDSSEDSSDDDLSELKIKGYILSINDSNVDLNELLQKTNLEDKTPVHGQLSSSYNSAAIIETNQKIGPLYLVDCKYNKNTKKYSIDKDSKQLITDFIQYCDVLVFLHEVDSSVAKKAILVEKGDKSYYYPLSTEFLDDLSGQDLIENK